MPHLRILAVLALSLSLATLASAQVISLSTGDVAQAGSGSYLLRRPRLCKELPAIVPKTDAFTKLVPAGQWWSSLLWQDRKFSQPLFADPLVLTAGEEGLIVGYPGSHVSANRSGIFADGSARDFTIGHTAAHRFQSLKLDNYSDWFVSAIYSGNEPLLRVSFGHGSPFVYCLHTHGDVELRFAGVPTIWFGNVGNAVLGVTVNNHHYGLFGAPRSHWNIVDGRRFHNLAQGTNFFSVALLPDNGVATLALFRKYAYNHVTNTHVDYRIAGGNVIADYAADVTSNDKPATDTIFALYPHQWKYATTTLTSMTYGSVRGMMKVAIGRKCTTSVPIQGVLPMLPGDGLPSRSRIHNYLAAEFDLTRDRAVHDTYYEGKLLGRLATLSGVAEAAGETDLQRLFLAEIKRRLEIWFIASPGKERGVFYYDPTWNTLVGSPPSFGSDRPLNDHHFHYGYFIRAAAEVARSDRDWARRWGPMVQMLIRDIATADRGDKQFAYLRTFDRYAGHSWASGDANFADGNNQESSSEAMNAWYGMILWGQATGDTQVRDAGLFLFNTERTAVEEYWFDAANTNFPIGFPHVALGMLWGGKGAFGTWFSADIDCIHGINWLPFTPGSLYLGRHADYVQKSFDHVLAGRKGGNDFNTGWGDLVVMFGGLANPAMAAGFIDDHPDCKLEGGNSHAFMYHWCHTLDKLGIVDAAVTADYPIYAVFNREGVRTYAVYNFEPAPRVVTFSDGMRVTAPPGQMTVKQQAR